MNTVHAKSPCCRARVIHFGGRRRQCVRCGRTWRIREKRRGRKRLRAHLKDTLRRFENGMSLRRLAALRSVSREHLRRRHARGLTLLLRQLPPPPIPSGELIAIIDGLWFRFQGAEYTLYLILFRPVRGSTAVLQEPLLLPGHESSTGWRTVFGLLPHAVRERIVALVSDGITGIEALVGEQGWIHQRCHFHLLAQLQHFRGRRNQRIGARPLREEVYQTVRAILSAQREATVQRHVRHLCRLIARPECPYWLGRRVRGFLPQLAAFRACRRHPSLHLPSTTNTAESAGNMLRVLLRRTRGFRTVESCRRWITVWVRTHFVLRCNGAFYQPK